MSYQASLSKEEKTWVLQPKVTRLTDNKEVQIYPMGAERYLSAVLAGRKPGRYAIKEQIAAKNLLVIPGFGTSAFLLAQAGAQSVTVYDKDPVTMAWMRAFTRYYHYRGDAGSAYPSIGELFAALTCWYPPCLRLPTGRYRNSIYWAIHPQALRRVYIFYMLYLVQSAIKADIQNDYALVADIRFYTGELSQVSLQTQTFDLAFVPYLLGVKNGIEAESDIVDFIKKLVSLVPNGPILVNPTRNSKEFYWIGKRYFRTTAYANIQDIPGLKAYIVAEDRHWFGTQGLTVLQGV